METAFKGRRWRPELLRVGASEGTLVLLAAALGKLSEEVVTVILIS